MHGLLFLCVTCFLLYSSWSSHADLIGRSYEIEGTIEQIIQDDRFPLQVKGEFKVFVQDCAWRIQVIEDKQFPQRREYLKREIGSTNGTEIFEVVTPLDPGGGQTNTPPRRARNSRFNTATLVSNAVPVGQLEGSVVGHLWLMLASQCHLSGLKTNMLTPVYDVSASAPGNPNLKYKAEWELIAGPGSLPLNVTYFTDSGTTNAMYRATGMTNVNGTTFPTGFLFEHYMGGDLAQVRKRATVVVTHIRTESSLTNLLPIVTDKTVVVDRRLAQAAQPTRVITYTATSNTPLPTIADAKKTHERKATPPKRSPVVVAVLVTMFCLPLAAGTIYFWRRGRKAG